MLFSIGFTTWTIASTNLNYCSKCFVLIKTNIIHHCACESKETAG